MVITANEELLSPEQAGERLGVSVYTVRRWIKEGRLRAFKPGKEYRIRESDLEEFLQAREVRPKAPRRSPYEPSFNDMLAEERRLPALAQAIDRAANVWARRVRDPHADPEEKRFTHTTVAVLVDQVDTLLGGDFSAEEQRALNAASTALGRVDEAYAEHADLRARGLAVESDERQRQKNREAERS